MKIAPILALAAILFLPCAAQAQTSRTRIVTGSNGNSATRNVTGAYTPGAGYTRTATTTGSNGKTAGSTRTVTGTPYVRNVQSTAYGPSGNTASSNVYRGPRGHIATGSVTGPQSHSRNFFRFHR